MVSDLFFSQLVLIALLWLCLMLQWAWPSDRAPAPPMLPRRTRRREPTPFAGLTNEPHCDACARASDPRPQAPASPPPRIVMRSSPPVPVNSLGSRRGTPAGLGFGR
jgi:hypothetical protein